MFCRKCGKEIPDDSEFCYKCGTPVAIKVEHSKQGQIAENSPERKFKVTLEKPLSPVNNNWKRLCPKCGEKIFSDKVKFCPYCDERLPADSADKQEAVTEKSHEGIARPNSSYTDTKHTPSANTLVSPPKNQENTMLNTQKSIPCPKCTSVIPNDSGLPICKTCGKPVPKGNAFCPICGTDLPQGVISSSRQKDKVPYKYSDAYLSLKKRTNIVVGVIIGLVIIVMIISGKAEVINGEVYTDDRGAGFYVGIVIGLTVLRMIFLGLCKFWHSND